MYMICPQGILRTCIAVSFAHNGSRLLPDDKLSHALNYKEFKIFI